ISSNNISINNLSFAFPNLSENEKKEIIKQMWANYGKIFSEYMFIKKFRKNLEFSNKIQVENQEELEKIKHEGKPVIFISGHFNNFELMAMYIEKSKIDLAAVYRPLNNIFLNPIMERIRKKYICKKQIKKGISGTKEILKEFKNGTSIALMMIWKNNFFKYIKIIIY
ncbi:lipid A biosynthesis acyltransferase, partial [Pelagibacterales bacterium SAG-MED38]|nr:lipid A biosynthesis acyltransferase [Pelagibacterales bacterium SAG-MED38]